MVTLSGNHFGRSVARTTTSGLESFTVFVSVRKAKVDNLDVVLVIEE